MVARPLMAIVDDDESVREPLPALLVELGYVARAFALVEEFLVSECIAGARAGGAPSDRVVRCRRGDSRGAVVLGRDRGCFGRFNR